MNSELDLTDIAARLALADRTLDDGDSCGALAMLTGAATSLRALTPSDTLDSPLSYGPLDVCMVESVAAIESGRDPRIAVGAAIRQAEMLLAPHLVGGTNTHPGPVLH